MLSAVNKVQIMGQINKYSLEQLQSGNIIHKDANSMKYFDLFEYLEGELENRINKPRNKSVKIISKLIYSLIATIDASYTVNNEILFTDELYEKTLNLKKIYQENIKNVDEYDIVMFDNLYDKMAKIEITKFNSSENKNDTVEDIENSDENDLKTKIDEYKNKIKILKKEKKELNSKINSLNNIIDESIKKEELELYKTQLKELEEKNEELNITICKLEFDNSRLNNDNKKLKYTMSEEKKFYDEEYNILKKKFDSATIDAQKYNEYITNSEINTEIDRLVLENIVETKQNISEIFSVLHFLYPNITKETIFDSLKRLRNNYSISQNSIYDYEKSYGIGLNYYDNYSIDKIGDVLDIIVISDMHINDDIESSLYNLNLIYEYAKRNGIKIIVNLGDFIDGHFTNYNNKLDQFKYNDELISKIIESLPKDASIINLLLGGNHDRLVMSQGIDIVNRVANERMDYASLNYDHSFLNIGNSTLGLHHVNKRYTDDFIKNTSCDNSLVNSHLESYYDRKKVQKSNIYLDLLGHYHISKFSSIGSYVTIPSLNNDHIQNGAWRLRFFFDGYKNIIETVMIPLIVENKVLSSSSFNYQKVK